MEWVEEMEASFFEYKGVYVHPFRSNEIWSSEYRVKMETLKKFLLKHL
jgi:hypothetical protein